MNNNRNKNTSTRNHQESHVPSSSSNHQKIAQSDYNHLPIVSPQNRYGLMDWDLLKSDPLLYGKGVLYGRMIIAGSYLGNRKYTATIEQIHDRVVQTITPISAEEFVDEDGNPKLTPLTEEQYESAVEEGLAPQGWEANQQFVDSTQCIIRFDDFKISYNDRRSKKNKPEVDYYYIVWDADESVEWSMVHQIGAALFSNISADFEAWLASDPIIFRDIDSEEFTADTTSLWSTSMTYEEWLDKFLARNEAKPSDQFLAWVQNGFNVTVANSILNGEGLASLGDIDNLFGEGVSKKYRIENYRDYGDKNRRDAIQNKEGNSSINDRYGQYYVLKNIDVTDIVEGKETTIVSDVTKIEIEEDGQTIKPFFNQQFDESSGKHYFSYLNDNNFQLKSTDFGPHTYNVEYYGDYIAYNTQENLDAYNAWIIENSEEHNSDPTKVFEALGFTNSDDSFRTEPPIVASGFFEDDYAHFVDNYEIQQAYMNSFGKSWFDLLSSDKDLASSVERVERYSDYLAKRGLDDTELNKLGYQADYFEAYEKSTGQRAFNLDKNLPDDQQPDEETDRVYANLIHGTFPLELSNNKTFTGTVSIIAPDIFYDYRNRYLEFLDVDNFGFQSIVDNKELQYKYKDEFYSNLSSRRLEIIDKSDEFSPTTYGDWGERSQLYPGYLKLQRNRGHYRVYSDVFKNYVNSFVDSGRFPSFEDVIGQLVDETNLITNADYAIWDFERQSKRNELYSEASDPSNTYHSEYSDYQNDLDDWNNNGQVGDEPIDPFIGLANSFLESSGVVSIHGSRLQGIPSEDIRFGDGNIYSEPDQEIPEYSTNPIWTQWDGYSAEKKQETTLEWDQWVVDHEAWVELGSTQEPEPEEPSGKYKYPEPYKTVVNKMRVENTLQFREKIADSLEKVFERDIDYTVDPLSSETVSVDLGFLVDKGIVPSEEEYLEKYKTNYKLTATKSFYYIGGNGEKIYYQEEDRDNTDLIKPKEELIKHNSKRRSYFKQNGSPVTKKDFTNIGSSLEEISFDFHITSDFKRWYKFNQFKGFTAYEMLYNCLNPLYSTADGQSYRTEKLLHLDWNGAYGTLENKVTKISWEKDLANNQTSLNWNNLNLSGYSLFDPTDVYSGKLIEMLIYQALVNKKPFVYEYYIEVDNWYLLPDLTDESKKAYDEEYSYKGTPYELIPDQEDESDVFFSELSSDKIYFSVKMKDEDGYYSSLSSNFTSLDRGRLTLHQGLIGANNAGILEVDDFKPLFTAVVSGSSFNIKEYTPLAKYRNISGVLIDEEVSIFHPEVKADQQYQTYQKGTQSFLDLTSKHISIKSDDWQVDVSEKEVENGESTYLQNKEEKGFFASQDGINIHKTFSIIEPEYYVYNDQGILEEEVPETSTEKEFSINLSHSTLTIDNPYQSKNSPNTILDSDKLELRSDAGGITLSLNSNVDNGSSLSDRPSIIIEDDSYNYFILTNDGVVNVSGDYKDFSSHKFGKTLEIYAPTVSMDTGWLSINSDGRYDYTSVITHSYLGHDQILINEFNYSNLLTPSSIVLTNKHSILDDNVRLDPSTGNELFNIREEEDDSTKTYSLAIPFGSFGQMYYIENIDVDTRYGDFQTHLALKNYNPALFGSPVVDIDDPYSFATPPNQEQSANISTWFSLKNWIISRPYLSQYSLTKEDLLKFKRFTNDDNFDFPNGEEENYLHFITPHYVDFIETPDFHSYASELTLKPNYLSISHVNEGAMFRHGLMALSENDRLELYPKAFAQVTKDNITIKNKDEEKLILEANLVAGENSSGKFVLNTNNGLVLFDNLTDDNDEVSDFEDLISKSKSTLTTSGVSFIDNLSSDPKFEELAEPGDEWGYEVSLGRLSGLRLTSNILLESESEDPNSEDSKIVGSYTTSIKPKEATFGGNVEVKNDLLIQGDFLVTGESSIIETSILSIEDPLIHLARGNEGLNIMDLGIYGDYFDASDQIVNPEYENYQNNLGNTNWLLNWQTENEYITQTQNEVATDEDGNPIIPSQYIGGHPTRFAFVKKRNTISDFYLLADLPQDDKDFFEETDDNEIINYQIKEDNFAKEYLATLYANLAPFNLTLKSFNHITSIEPDLYSQIEYAWESDADLEQQDGSDINTETEINSIVLKEGKITVSHELNSQGSLTVDGSAKLKNDLVIENTSLFEAYTTYMGDGGSDALAYFNLDEVPTETIEVFKVDNIGNTDIFGTASIRRTLSVDKKTTLSDELEVTGVTTLNDNLNIGDVGDDDLPQFSVIESSGNTNIKGTLGVKGITTLDSSLQSRNIYAGGSIYVQIPPNTDSGNTAPINTFEIDRDTGNTTIKGTLDVKEEDKLTTLSKLKVLDSIDISGFVTFGGYGDKSGWLITGNDDTNGDDLDNEETTENITTYIKASVDASVNDGLPHSVILISDGEDSLTTLSTVSSTINGTLAVTGTLDVDELTTLGGTLGVTGNTQLNNGLTVTDDLTTLGGTLGVTGNTQLDGGLTVSNELTTLGGTLDVTGATQLNNGLTVTDDLTTLGGTLSVAGATQLNNGLEVSNALTTLNQGLSVTGDVTTLTGSLTVTGATTFNDGSATAIDNTLTVTGATVLNSTLSVLNNLTTLHSLVVNGGITFNDITVFDGYGDESGWIITGNDDTDGGEYNSDDSDINSTTYIKASVDASVNDGLPNSVILISDGDGTEENTVITTLSAVDSTISGTITTTGTTTSGGKLTVSSDGLEVTGATTLNNKLTVSSGGLEVTGATTLNNKLTVSSGGLEVTGATLLQDTRMTSWEIWKNDDEDENTLSRNSNDGVLTLGKGLIKGSQIGEIPSDIVTGNSTDILGAGEVTYEAWLQGVDDFSYLVGHSLPAIGLSAETLEVLVGEDKPYSNNKLLSQDIFTSGINKAVELGFSEAERAFVTGYLTFYEDNSGQSRNTSGGFDEPENTHSNSIPADGIYSPIASRAWVNNRNIKLGVKQTNESIPYFDLSFREMDGSQTFNDNSNSILLFDSSDNSINLTYSNDSSNNHIINITADIPEQAKPLEMFFYPTFDFKELLPLIKEKGTGGDPQFIFDYNQFQIPGKWQDFIETKEVQVEVTKKREISKVNFTTITVNAIELWNTTWKDYFEGANSAAEAADQEPPYDMDLISEHVADTDLEHIHIPDAMDAQIGGFDPQTSQQIMPELDEPIHLRIPEDVSTEEEEYTVWEPTTEEDVVQSLVIQPSYATTAELVATVAGQQQEFKHGWIMQQPNGTQVVEYNNPIEYDNLTVVYVDQYGERITQPNDVNTQSVKGFQRLFEFFSHKFGDIESSFRSKNFWTGKDPYIPRKYQYYLANDIDEASTTRSHFSGQLVELGFPDIMNKESFQHLDSKHNLTIQKTTTDDHAQYFGDLFDNYESYTNIVGDLSEGVDGVIFSEEVSTKNVFYAVTDSHVEEVFNVSNNFQVDSVSGADNAASVVGITENDTEIGFYYPVVKYATHWESNTRIPINTAMYIASDGGDLVVTNDGQELNYLNSIEQLGLYFVNLIKKDLEGIFNTWDGGNKPWLYKDNRGDWIGFDHYYQPSGTDNLVYYAQSKLSKGYDGKASAQHTDLRERNLVDFTEWVELRFTEFDDYNYNALEEVFQQIYDTIDGLDNDYHPLEGNPNLDFTAKTLTSAGSIAGLDISASGGYNSSDDSWSGGFNGDLDASYADITTAVITNLTLKNPGSTITNLLLTAEQNEALAAEVSAEQIRNAFDLVDDLGVSLLDKFAEEFDTNDSLTFYEDLAKTFDSNDQYFEEAGTIEFYERLAKSFDIFDRHNDTAGVTVFDFYEELAKELDTVTNFYLQLSAQLTSGQVSNVGSFINRYDNLASGFQTISSDNDQDHNHIERLQQVGARFVEYGNLADGFENESIIVSVSSQNIDGAWRLEQVGANLDGYGHIKDGFSQNGDRLKEIGYLLTGSNDYSQIKAGFIEGNPGMVNLQEIGERLTIASDYNQIKVGFANSDDRLKEVGARLVEYETLADGFQTEDIDAAVPGVLEDQNGVYRLKQIGAWLTDYEQIANGFSVYDDGANLATIGGLLNSDSEYEAIKNGFVVGGHLPEIGALLDSESEYEAIKDGFNTDDNLNEIGKLLGVDYDGNTLSSDYDYIKFGFATVDNLLTIGGMLTSANNYVNIKNGFAEKEVNNVTGETRLQTIGGLLSSNDEHETIKNGYVNAGFLTNVGALLDHEDEHELIKSGYATDANLEIVGGLINSNDEHLKIKTAYATDANLEIIAGYLTNDVSTIKGHFVNHDGGSNLVTIGGQLTDDIDAIKGHFVNHDGGSNLVTIGGKLTDDIDAIKGHFATDANLATIGGLINTEPEHLKIKTAYATDANLIIIGGLITEHAAIKSAYATDDNLETIGGLITEHAKVKLGYDTDDNLGAIGALLITDNDYEKIALGFSTLGGSDAGTRLQTVGANINTNHDEIAAGLTSEQLAIVGANINDTDTVTLAGGATATQLEFVAQNIDLTSTGLSGITGFYDNIALELHQWDYNHGVNTPSGSKFYFYNNLAESLSNRSQYVNPSDDSAIPFYSKLALGLHNTDDFYSNISSSIDIGNLSISYIDLATALLADDTFCPSLSSVLDFYDDLAKGFDDTKSTTGFYNELASGFHDLDSTIGGSVPGAIDFYENLANGVASTTAFHGYIALELADTDNFHPLLAGGFFNAYSVNDDGKMAGEVLVDELIDNSAFIGVLASNIATSTDFLDALVEWEDSPHTFWSKLAAEIDLATLSSHLTPINTLSQENMYGQKTISLKFPNDVHSDPDNDLVIDHTHDFSENISVSGYADSTQVDSSGTVAGTTDYWPSGGYSNPSDIRWKENISNLTESSLDKLSKLEVFNYVWKKDRPFAVVAPEKIKVGISAQSLEEQYPELIYEVNGVKNIDTLGLTTTVIKATQELKEENQQLKKENQELKDKVERLYKHLGLN